MTAVQNTLSTFYTHACHHASKGCHQSITWMRKSSSYAFSQLSVISALARRHIFNSFQAGKTFLWNHKGLLVGGAGIAIALWFINRLNKNRPQQPILQIKSSLNYAKLTIQIPKEKYVPPNVALTFCVDTSGSMSGGREDDVKKALNEVLKNAQQVIDTTKEAKISLAIVEFNNNAKLTLPITSLQHNEGKTGNSAFTTIENQIKSIKSEGGTQILVGLETATAEIEKSTDRECLHTLVLLTDGGDSIDDKKLSSIQQRLALKSAQLFAVGIGSGHNKETLRKIAQSSKKGLQGRYIDTADGKETIGTAISKIYNQAIGSFQQLELTTSQLKPGTWSVLGLPSTVENSVQKVDLGSLKEGEILTKKIQIYPEKLDKPLELMGIKFWLTFTDPKGRKGRALLPWDPNTKIDSSVFV